MMSQLFFRHNSFIVLPAIPDGGNQESDKPRKPCMVRKEKNDFLCYLRGPDRTMKD